MYCNMNVREKVPDNYVAGGAYYDDDDEQIGGTNPEDAMKKQILNKMKREEEMALAREKLLLGGSFKQLNIRNNNNDDDDDDDAGGFGVGAVKQKVKAAFSKDKIPPQKLPIIKVKGVQLISSSTNRAAPQNTLNILPVNANQQSNRSKSSELTRADHDARTRKKRRSNSFDDSSRKHHHHHHHHHQQQQQQHKRSHSNTDAAPSAANKSDNVTRSKATMQNEGAMKILTKLKAYESAKRHNRIQLAIELKQELNRMKALIASSRDELIQKHVSYIKQHRAQDAARVMIDITKLADALHLVSISK